MKAGMESKNEKYGDKSNRLESNSTGGASKNIR